MRPTLLLGWLVACAPDPGGGGPPAAHCTDVFYADADADGHGDADTTSIDCAAPNGYTATSDDCDDTNAAIRPSTNELCNDVDDDCDGTIDVGAVDASIWHWDADSDGFGGKTATTSCTQPAGFVAGEEDCNDLDPAIRPDASEMCNEIDDDCDALVDELDPTLADGTVWFADADGDRYGDAEASLLHCDQPDGMVDDDSDCDDADRSVHPGVTEVCDGVDNDCDGFVDDDDDDLEATDVFYVDADGDGYGASGSARAACMLLSGYSVNDFDCDDAAATITVALDYYNDRDADGYGAGVSHAACAPDSNDVAIDGDCEGEDAAIHPRADEVCNSVDDNCDGAVDEEDPLLVDGALYADTDGDGHGDDSDTLVSCTDVVGYVRTGGDCAVDDDETYPGSPEYCDGVDNDCTGTADDAVVYVDWYADTDEDGYGDPDDGKNDCVQPSGYLLDASDCDDGDATVSPLGTEVCANDVDEDCDDAVDNCDMVDPEFVLEGADNADALGSSLAVGDFDADGTADLLCGAPGAESRDGRAYLVFGPATGTVWAPDTPAISTSTSKATLGTVGAGDVSDDGLEDLVVGAAGASAAYVFLGPITAGHDVTDADATFEGGPTGSGTGSDVAVVGDVDGDSLVDIVLGGAAARGHAGIVYVVGGAASGTVALDSASSYVFQGVTSLGYGSTAMGDANGDGIDDLAIGAARGGDFGYGGIYVIEGGMAPGTYDPELVATAIVSSSGPILFGWGMVGVDYDQDGTSDLISGAWGPDYDTHDDYAGEVYGFLGPLSGAIDTESAHITWGWAIPPVSYESLGQEVAAGDVDGDKVPDVLIGSPGGNDNCAGCGSGAAYLQLGLASGFVDVHSLVRFPSDALGWSVGSAVALVPDWDGDDGMEVAIGASRADTTAGADEAGTVNVFLSSRF